MCRIDYEKVNLTLRVTQTTSHSAKPAIVPSHLPRLKINLLSRLDYLLSYFGAYKIFGTGE